MRNYAESAWTAVQAPEVLLAVSGVREEALVFALEVCKYVYEEYSVSGLKISFLDLFYIFVKFPIPWIIEIELSFSNDQLVSLRDFHGYLPLPGSGVVGGSGVVSLLLKDSPSSVLVCPLRLVCFLRELRSAEPLRVLLRLRFFGRSVFSATLTVFPPSESSAAGGS